MKLLKLVGAMLASGELVRLQQLVKAQADVIKHYQQREVDLIARAEKAEAANVPCDDCHALRGKIEGLEVMLDNAEAALIKAGFTQNKEHGEWTPPAPTTACNHRFEAVERIGSSGLVETVVECVSCGQAGDPLEQAVTVDPDVLSDNEAYMLKAALNRHQHTGDLELQNCYDAIKGGEAHSTMQNLCSRGYMKYDCEYTDRNTIWGRYRLTEKGATAVGGTLIYWEGK